MIVESLSSRVLLIAPFFFGYEHEISAGLTNFGYEVDLLPDRAFNNPMLKAMMRFRPELGAYYLCDKFFTESLEKLGRTNYSIILVIQGEGVTANTLMMFRKQYPRARLIFYTWDSLENKPFSLQNWHFYDRCLTFDPVDAKKYGMSYRPLFYSEGFNIQSDAAYSYDISFIGTVHSDRYRIVHQLLEQLPMGTRTYVCLYLQAPWIYDFRRIFTNTVRGAKRGDFSYEPLSKYMVKDIFLHSRAVLDIEHVNQRGATMRTIEALGSNRKLITTNASLRDYDFFDPDNIKIIDREVPRLDCDFLQIPYKPVPEAIKIKYALKQWISDVCIKL